MSSEDIELHTAESENSINRESVESVKTRIPLLRYALMLFSASMFAFIAGYDFSAPALALPVVGIRFSKLSTVNWVVVAYMIPFATLLPSIKKLAAVSGHRTCVAVFAILHIAGSVMSGVAQGMPLLLAGRVIAGLGAAGTAMAPLIAIESSGSSSQRILGLWAFLAVWLMGSVVGLIAGGCLATWDSWRWVFYFDIPFLGAAAIVGVLAMRVPAHQGSKMQVLKNINALGTIFAAGSVLTLALALNFGGNLFKWSSGVVITLLVLSVFLFLVLIFIEAKMTPEPLLPSSMFKTRTSMALLAIQPFVGIATFVPMVYLILWYDAVKSLSSDAIGARMLSLGLSVLVAALIAEFVVSIFKRSRPLVRLSTPFMTLGCGLLIILQENTNRNLPVAFMILLGVGVGLSIQPHFIMIHGASGAESMASVVASVLMLRIFGAAVGIALCNAVLQNNLSTKLASVVLEHPLYTQYIIMSVDNSDIMRLSSVPQSVSAAVAKANAEGFRSTFIVSLAFAAVTIPLLIFIGRRKA
ncbi:hypothetical protein IWW36_001877 [Coemansia brasiliensis]|uniref:Major facilitator superfamily (MFS) profile domain-containing protein n=1 Tax=Coemansia brasiliensis TaxID=2650707 RepID=A0A9W8M1J7_9FUNG|nr:hypothetical protein IWW36_001877 [Coemansia brasiliensis]